MKGQNRKVLKNDLIDSIIKSRRGEISLRYFSPNPSQQNKSVSNIFLKKSNKGELSRLSDRSFIVNNNPYTKYKKPRFISVDRTKYYSEKNSYRLNGNKILDSSNRIINLNNNYHYKPYNSAINTKRKKNVVVFAECPRKLSDYILKIKNKKKMYRLLYIDLDDFDYNKFYQMLLYQNFYDNINNRLNDSMSRRNHDIMDYNFKTHIDNYNYNYNNNESSYLYDIYNNENNNYSYINDRYSNNKNNYTNKKIIYFKNNNSNKNRYNINDIYTNNQNNDQLKVIKIQSIWRGYIFRKYLLKSLNNFYIIMKLLNSLINIFYNKCKPILKLFLNKLQKNLQNNNLYKKIAIKSLKTQIKNKTQNEVRKIPLAGRKNTKVYKPKEKINNISQKCFIYKKISNSPKSPRIIKKYNNMNNTIVRISRINYKSNKSNRNNNIELKGNRKNYELFKNYNYRNKIKTAINHISKYTIKKSLSLHFPLLLYRLRILQKMNLIELKYKYLIKIMQINDKIILRNYFHKYKNIIFSPKLNEIFSEKKINKKDIGNKDNINNNDNKNNNKGNNRYKLRNYIIYRNKDNLDNNKYINNNKKQINNIKINKNIYKDNKDNKDKSTNYKLLSQKNQKNKLPNKIVLLTKIIKNKDIKTNSILSTFFNKWKYNSKNIFISKELRWNRYKSNRISLNRNKNKNKTPGSSSKKSIRIKIIKGKKNLNNSQTKSFISGKPLINSFQSENASIKKMKINKINVLSDSSEIKNNLSKDFILRNNSTQNIDNSFFIQKIASITNKINDKNYLFKNFKNWKKKSKEKK